METTNTPTPNAANPPEPTAAPPSAATASQPKAPATTILKTLTKLPLRLKVALIAVSILLLSVFVLILIPKKSGPRILIPSPTPLVQATFSPIPRVTSEFSKTEEFQRFEQNLSSMQTDTTEVDLDETQLSFPLLDRAIRL